MARRRGQRKGYLYQRGPSWFLQYRVDTPDLDDKGKPKRQTLTRIIGDATGPAKISRREAERIAWNEVLSKVDQASMHPGSMMTLAQFVTAKFEPDVIWSLKTTGKSFYRSMLKQWVLPNLGRIQLRSLGPDDAQWMVRAVISAGRSTQTALHAKNCLSAILRHARTLKLISGELATENVRMPEMVREERKAPSWEEVMLISAKMPPPVDLLVLFLATTGLRIGEAMGLRWRRVNLTDQPVSCDMEWVAPNAVFVLESFVRGKYQSLKNNPSKRIIPLPEWLAAQLWALKGDAGPDDPVFAAARTGTPLDCHNVAKRILKPGLIAMRDDPNIGLDLTWVSWHCFRHCSASMADQAGLTLTERQKVLGHANSEMTLHYSHADVESVRRKLEKIQPTSERVVLIDKRKKPA